jgi:hypothetical protein
MPNQALVDLLFLWGQAYQINLECWVQLSKIHDIVKSRCPLLSRLPRALRTLGHDISKISRFGRSDRK